MRFGLFYEHQLPRPWDADSEHRLLHEALEQIEIADRVGFDYVWEVYKPLGQRKFGYYTLPILWGDRLVARFDSKPDRITGTFVVLGLWLEEEAQGLDEAFAVALARGFARFVRFLGASKLDATAIGEPLLRRRACSSQGATEGEA